MQEEKVNILVVEDDEDLLKVLKTALDREGYGVRAALTAKETLGIKEGFDIAILDIRLPDMDGIELLRLLKGREPGMDAIIITGYSSLESAVDALRIGIWDYLVKPFPVEELCRTVKNLVERRLAQAKLLKTQERLKGLHHITSLLLSSVDSEEVFRLILKKAMELVGADEGSLLFFDEEGQELRIKSSIGIPPRVVKNTKIKIGQRIAGWAAEHKEPLLINDGLSNDPRFRGLKKRNKIQSNISYPLLVSNRVVGVLCLNRTVPGRDFDQDDLGLCGMMAANAGLALEKGLYYTRMKEMVGLKTRDLEESNKRLLVLQRVCDTMRGTLKLDEILRVIVDGITTGLGYRYATVSLVNKEENVFHVRVVSAQPLLLKKVERLLGEKVVGLKTSLTGEIIPHLKRLRNGETIIFHDLTELFGKGFGLSASNVLQELLKVKTVVSIPMLLRDELIGTILVFSLKGWISEEEKKLLATLASTAAISINQADIFVSLQKAYKEISSVEEMKTCLLQNVSHEFRTPITVIEGYAEILMESMMDSVKREDFQVIIDECKNLDSLVNRMIDLAKLEEGRLRVRPSPTDIRLILERAILEKEEGFKKKGVHFESMIQGPIPSVWADGLAVERVFSCLLENALKFTPEGGRVTIETIVHPDSIDVVISDTGIGIKEERLKRITERFYQADPSLTREVGGLGIGLTVAKHIIDLHRGRLWIKSKEGVGTKVVVRLLVEQ